MALNTTDNSNYDKFYNYLNELFTSYSKLENLLAQKLSAIASFDIGALDNIIKEEQVFVLLSRGFDSQLQSFREKLSFKGDSLSVVIKEMPEEERPRFEAIFLRLKAKLDEVKKLNERCQSVIEDRMYTIGRSINQLDPSSASPYGKSGTAAAKHPDEPQILKKSV